jgi:hypothetical protein
MNEFTPYFAKLDQIFVNIETSERKSFSLRLFNEFLSDDYRQKKTHLKLNIT